MEFRQYICRRRRRSRSGGVIVGIDPPGTIGTPGSMDQCVPIIYPDDDYPGRNAVQGFPIAEDTVPGDTPSTFTWHTDYGHFKFYDNGGNEGLDACVITGDMTDTFSVAGPWATLWSLFSENNIYGSVDLNGPTPTTDIVGTFTFSLVAGPAHGFLSLPIMTVEPGQINTSVTVTGTSVDLGNLAHTDTGNLFPCGTWRISLTNLAYEDDPNFGVELMIWASWFGPGFTFTLNKAVGSEMFFGPNNPFLVPDKGQIVIRGPYLEVRDMIAGTSGSNVTWALATSDLGEFEIGIDARVVPHVDDIWYIFGVTSTGGQRNGEVVS